MVSVLLTNQTHVQVDVPILSSAECRRQFKQSELDQVDQDIWVCAGYAEGGKDACEVSF